MRRLLLALADTAPVVVLAGIAAAGSFTHIRDTVRDHGQHGWMAWAVAVCIDLTCVMAARERQRDKRTGRTTARISWPTCVLVGGILLSLAANLAQAEPTVWGWVTAGTPAAAFLVAVSMLERRTTARPAARPDGSSSAGMAVPPSFGRPDLPSPSPSSPVPPSPVPSPVPSSVSSLVGVEEGTRPALTTPDPSSVREGQTEIPLPDSSSSPKTTGPGRSSSVGSSAGPAAALVDFARQVAAEHQAKHGRPITRDALRARLKVSNQLASELLRHIRNHPTA
ncbi:DUF2637 domain-containing protein [Thermomonospora catenispora]|uniref:DUF2637 domain-containing protein n=1 Tax=Thermomonospora catenispora TaxID=2493090 RepID=UPI001121F02E|nr:DUF2637 domain-containing protein [Thermomonospora catenispora]TNY38090.1 DUF2637 domain-containing protein [Thermomonospora catenispora]